MTIAPNPPATDADRARQLAADGGNAVAMELRRAAKAEHDAARRMARALAAADLSGLSLREVAALLATPAAPDGVHHKTASSRMANAWPEVMGDEPRPVRRRGGPRKLSASERVERARQELADALAETGEES